MIKISIRFFLALIILACVAFVLQYLLFNWLFYSNDPENRADVVVVFTGEKQRVEYGMRLLEAGRAKRLIVSSSNERQVVEFYRMLGLAESSKKVLMEPNARSTYENAYYTGKIIVRKNINSVIIVTSRYHIPRAYLLLRLILLNESVKIYRAPCDVEGNDERNAKHIAIEQKLIYNEMISAWGSLYELSFHYITGKLAPRIVKSTSIIRSIERLLTID